MKKHKAYLISIAILLLLPDFSFAQTGAWKLAKDQNGIKVYTRHIDGYAIDELITAITPETIINQINADLQNFINKVNTAQEQVDEIQSQLQ